MHAAKQRCLTLICLAALAAALPLSGCSPLYVGQAIFRHSALLLKRRAITEVMADPLTGAEEKRKLGLVMEARGFAQSMGLDPKGAFSYYTRLDSKVLAWVLAACQKDAFAPYTWWFPFVGRVPYQGFFNREAGDAAARDLQRKGYETWLRPTEAFSTLGWFDDPVLSTTLANPDEAIVQTVLHESTHSSLWQADQVQFNESLANFVGLQGAIDFYESKLRSCLAAAPHCPAAARDRLALDYRAALEQRDRQLELAAVVEALHRDLSALYGGNLSRAEKISRRAAVFDNQVSAFHQRHPQRQILLTANNAEILQLSLYLSNLGDFQGLYASVGRDWRRFFAEIREVLGHSGTGAGPFPRLKAKITT